MFFENTAVNASQFVTAVGPAFVAGFGVQRLLEILDSWIGLDKKTTPEWRKAILSFASLVSGFILAYGLGIKVLTSVFGPGNTSEVYAALDLVLSALVISAGTEGFNSILKFLSYSKETKKADAVVKTAIANDRKLGITRSILATVGSVENDGIPTGDLEGDLETTLENEIKRTWPDKFDPEAWKETAFKDYTDFEDDPKIVVLDATLKVAAAYKRFVTKENQIRLQAEVTLDTTPEDILPEMRNAILFP